LYAAGEMVRLQRELKRWALLAFFPSAFLALIFIIKGHWFLALFGAEFVNPETKIVLSILTVAQLILVAAGPVGLLFVMSGHERFAAQSLTAGAVRNVVLNAVLIPIWGVRGAAMATAVSTTLFTFLLISFSIRRLQLNPTIFPFRL
jgi:O-antigen/teichoic acid export membrane protein